MATGVDEIILARNFKLMFLDGKTGAVRKSVPRPSTRSFDRPLRIEFKKHPFNSSMWTPSAS
jgi:hypothetical protein